MAPLSTREVVPFLNLITNSVLFANFAVRIVKSMMSSKSSPTSQEANGKTAVEPTQSLPRGQMNSG